MMGFRAGEACVLAAICLVAALSLGSWAQSISTLPQCAQVCINNALGLANALGCSSADAACLCANPNFGYGIRDCTNQTCPSGSAADDGLFYAAEYCALATATGTATSGKPTTLFVTEPLISTVTFANVTFTSTVGTTTFEIVEGSSSSSSAKSQKTTTTSSSPTPLPLASGGLSTSSKIGIGVGVGVGVPLLLCLAALMVFRRRRNSKPEPAAVESPSTFEKSELDPSAELPKTHGRSELVGGRVFRKSPHAPDFPVEIAENEKAATTKTRAELEVQEKERRAEVEDTSRSGE